MMVMTTTTTMMMMMMMMIRVEPADVRKNKAGTDFKTWKLFQLFL